MKTDTYIAYTQQNVKDERIYKNKNIKIIANAAR